MKEKELQALIREQELDYKRELFNKYCISCTSNLYDTCKNVMHGGTCEDIAKHKLK